jgi:hypothetical protein
MLMAESMPNPDIKSPTSAINKLSLMLTMNTPIREIIRLPSMENFLPMLSIKNETTKYPQKLPKNITDVAN